MTATVKYPANDVLPQGAYMVFKGDHPDVGLRAYDGSIDFYLMGGLSIADRYASPECVQILRDGLKGLIAPWKHIDQKGATEDGITQIDALYDPIEVELNLLCCGRDGRHVQRVVRDLIASLDAKQQSEMFFRSHDMGYWWAPVRWYKGAPPNTFIGAQQRRQKLSLRLRADNGFWRTYDDTDAFGFIYDSMTATFTDAVNMGSHWPVYDYPDSGSGHPYVTGSQVAWSESGTAAHGVVIGPYDEFDSDTDNQVIEMELGKIPEYVYANGAYNDMWLRMGRDGDDWDGNGVRARIGVKDFIGYVELARFNDFTKTTLFSRNMFFRPHSREKFGFIAGVGTDPRTFRITRNGLPILSHKETGTGSELGASFRGVGLGMLAGAGTSQRSPAWVKSFTAGDNATATQSGFLTRTNIGDQPMYDDYTVFGPFTALRIWNGPNAGPDEYVEFGPLLANQAALIRTDPRDRNVYDLAAVPAVPQTQAEQGIFGAALSGLLSFATIGNTNPLLQVIQSIFGIFGSGQAPVPPQGSLYALLKGRFSDDSAIPPKSPGNPAQPYSVKIEIVGGNADTKVIASGTPLRRYPL